MSFFKDGDKMRQVFISYARRDFKLAEKIANALKDRGIRVFLDKWNIRIGERIAEVIGNGIAGSNYIIVLASKDSMASNWVKAELYTALNYEIDGKATLLIVKLDDCSLPPLVQGKLYLSLKGKNINDIDDEVIQSLVEAIQPNIFLQAGKHKVVDFSGCGGNAKVKPIESGTTFYRIEIFIPHKGAFAGVFWEPLSGCINVANYTHFRWFMRANPTGGRIQVKFETKGGWPTHYALLDSSEWKENHVLLKNLCPADWERLERITFAMDDRDVFLGQHQIIDLRGFLFYRSNINDT